MTDTVSALHPELAPYLAREQAKNVVELNHHRKEAARASGVSWGGLGPGPVVERSLRNMIAAAEASYQRDHQAKVVIAKRLYAALHELEQLGWLAEVSQVRGIANRAEFLSDRAPLCADAIGAALKVLIPINHSDAREACAALADLLMVQAQEPA